MHRHGSGDMVRGAMGLQPTFTGWFVYEDVLHGDKFALSKMRVATIVAFHRLAFVVKLLQFHQACVDLEIIVSF
jgi:hypothetical protein